MRLRKVVFIGGLFATFSLPAAFPQTATKLSLDIAKPIVYIEFDHAGMRTPVQDGEPSKGFWLRLVNNSAIPIVVQANSTSTDPNMTILSDIVVAVQRKMPKTGSIRQKMPSGYGSDTGTPLTIEPGKSLVFSVPANHVSRTWSMQVPFQFSLPAVKQGVQPLCLAEFTWEDIPAGQA